LSARTPQGGPAIPIYHFNVHDGKDYPDLAGTDYPDLAAARVEAIGRIAKILQNGAPDFWSGSSWHMDVADATGLTLFTVMFLATNAPLAPAV
jgi:hypothetical protein